MTPREVIGSADLCAAYGVGPNGLLTIGEGSADIILRALHAAGFWIAPMEPTQELINTGRTALCDNGLPKAKGNYILDSLAIFD